MRVPSCSALSLERAEDLAGTASLVSRWLLLEDPGPWGYDALLDNKVPAPLLDELRAWARTVGARFILIRRRPRRRQDERRLFVAGSRRGHEWLRSMSSTDADALMSLDRSDFQDPDRFPGEPADPLFLICTHGRHDQCCSINGNPVAQALCAAYGERAWECSHIGGDRFAANVVCLPHGAYFGRVTTESAETVVETYEAGRLDLERFRGWSTLPFAVQAAESKLRRDFDLAGIDEVSVVNWERIDRWHHRATFATKGHGEQRVLITTSQSDEHYLTCRSTQRGRAPVFEITPD
ncbi:MAG TPA: sucrase ferredoxin [Actinomycetota bacterium]|nr:sucrase ferredoxin [Actinomycetota bacterium]